VIRYVLVLALAVTVLGMSTAALDRGAAMRGEQAVEREVRTLEDAAVELYQQEDPDPASDGPKRIVELDLPEARMTIDSVDTLVVVPTEGHDASRVTYRVENRREQTGQIAVPISAAGGGTLDLSERTGTQRLVLRLVFDSERGRVIEVSVT
jgi:hypothetical protein